MSASAMSYGLAVGTFLVMLLRLRRLRTTDNVPAVRFSVLLMGAMTFTFAVFAPSSQAWVNQYVGDLFKLLGNSSTLVAMFAAGALVLYINYPPDTARAKATVRAILLVAAVAVMVTMFALPHPVELTGSFDGLYAIDPSLIVYTLVYATYFGGTVAELAAQFHRFALRTSGAMRVGLHIMSMASVVAVAHNAATIFIVFRNAATGARQGAGGETGVCLSAFSDISCFIAIGSPAIAAALAILGFLTTYAVTYLDRMSRAMQRRRADRLLLPLWRTLVEAFPEVTTRTDSDEPYRHSKPNRVPRGRRLADRVVEIRDALLLLAPYRRDDTARRAREAAAAAGLTGLQRAAVIEAAEIVAALRERTRHQLDPEAPSPPPPAPAQPAADLDAELTWLTSVADALQISPIVESFRHATVGDAAS